MQGIRLGEGVLTQSLGNTPQPKALKEIGSHDKEIAAMPLGSRDYLWYLIGSRKTHSEDAYNGICSTPGPNYIGAERKVLADGRTHGKISGHFITQLKCYLTDYHYFKPGLPTPGLRERLSPAVWLFGNHWPGLFQQAGPIRPAIDRTWLGITCRQEQLHGEWSTISQVQIRHYRQGNRSPNPCCRNLSTKGCTDSPHQSLRISPRKEC